MTGDDVEISREIRDIIVSTRSDVKHIREIIDDFKSQVGGQLGGIKECVDDHENRIRTLEENRNQLIGKGAALGFAVLVLLQLAQIVWGKL